MTPTAAVPSHWESGNIRRFAQMKSGHTPSRSVSAYWEDTNIPWFTLADVWQLRDGKQIYLGDTANKINELGLANSAAELLPAGTVVLSRTASVGFSGIMPKPMATSQDFWNWVCGSELLPEYLNYQFRSMTAEFKSLNMGSTHQTIYQKDAATLQILVPPLEEQRAIAEYLDRETARIDTLIEEQQRLIEMLRERRDSAWAAHVEEARRLGQTLAVRRVIESIVDGPFGSSLTSAHYSDEGARVIRLGNIGVNEFKDGDAAFIPLDYAEELEAHAVEQGDVVVAGLGDDKMPLGRAAVVPALGPAIVKADCYRLRPNEQVSAAYLAWVMSAPQTRSQIMLLARGSTRARLNTKVVQQVEIPFPDRTTQDALVAQSDAETVKIDRLIAESERFVELSRERRAALITAAVTGQTDMRKMA
jgi:type I restriction enzyme, S subunit